MVVFSILRISLFFFGFYYRLKNEQRFFDFFFVVEVIKQIGEFVGETFVLNLTFIKNLYVDVYLCTVSVFKCKFVVIVTDGDYVVVARSNSFNQFVSCCVPSVERPLVQF